MRKQPTQRLSSERNMPRYARLVRVQMQAVVSRRVASWTVRRLLGALDALKQAQSLGFRPGRRCVRNECDDPKLNKCSRHAACYEDDADPLGYKCVCRGGFYDESGSSSESGRTCIALTEDQPAAHIENPLQQQQPQPMRERPTVAATPRDGVACGRSGLTCNNARREVCVGGNVCACRPGESRHDAKQRCERVERTPLTFRVVSRNDRPLFYSSEYGDQRNTPYVEFAEDFSVSLDHAIADTEYANRYVNTEITRLTHPKTLNSSWDDGKTAASQNDGRFQIIFFSAFRFACRFSRRYAAVANACRRL